jgi:hypothetical protein
MKKSLTTVTLLMLLTAIRAPAQDASDPAPLPTRKTLAVLPFVGGTDAEKALAERMRFAVSQKLANDANGGHTFDRLDNVQVDQTLSALQIPWGATADWAAEDDMQKVISTLGTDATVAGMVKQRTLTLRLYTGAVLAKTAAVDIPSDKESPKLAIEHVLSDLTGATFAHMRDVEADHSDPAAEKRFAQRPNLVIDSGFEAAANASGQKATAWTAILGPDHYAPPLLSERSAKTLGEDRVAIVPTSVAGDSSATTGHCLMMRMSKNVAESNGLACVSIWIPVTQGKKYRFSVKYHSEGPTARLFLKGFAYKPDAFGDKSDPEAVRREYYRAQVLPRSANPKFELIEMDFTPDTLKPTDPPIQWMRLDLYVYLTPGDIFFDDVVLKQLDP